MDCSTPATTQCAFTTRTPARRARRSPLRRVALALALCLSLASPLVFGMQSASAEGTRERTISWAILAQLNHERAVHGLPPLRMSWRLRESAKQHNREMALFNEMSHQLPGEDYFATRISQTGYVWVWAGENIAWNSRMTKAGALTLERQMYREKAPYDEHRLNILNTHFRDIGVAIYLDRIHHKLWLTTDFGSHR